MPSAMAKRQHDGDTSSTRDTEALPTSAAATADTASKFHHPYTPYDVQMQFMKTVYDICERGDGQVGILESPTGTGKSLSLICGALTWLREHKRKQFALSVAVDKTDAAYADEPDWVVEQMLKQKRHELAGRWERREARLREARRKEKAAEHKEHHGKRRRVELTRAERASRADEEFLLDEDASAHGEDRLSWFSADTRARLQKAGLTAKDASVEEEDDDDDVGDDITIYYTSRTHSQLTQFIAELRRPTFPSSVPESVSAAQTEVVKHIPLSSRQRLCINPSVNRLGSVAAINDRCAELQKPATTKDKDKEKDKETKQKGCPYVLSAENKAQTHQFRDTALATVPDIEDLYQLGTALHVCPYYASRTAVPGAEIVTLPYPLLLQKEARDALGIDLDSKNSIVIIDEAHNIMDAVASVHAAGIRLSELRRARALLGVYVKRLGKRLGPTSRLMVGQLGIVMAALCAWALPRQTQTASGIVDPTALLKHKGADQINLFTLVKYIQASKLAYKVEGYAAYIDEHDDKTASSSSSPVLHALSSFLLALTNLSSEGRIFYDAADGDVRLSYLLLSPTHAFSSIASSARAVILAGGTMSPFADYKTHLFPGLPASRLTTLSCGHVIPASNLCVVTLTSMRPARGGGVFDFSFAHRSDAAVVHNLGLALLNVCTVVPDGVVVFFPSYAYLDEVVAAWTASGLWAKLASRKKVLRESKGSSSDEVLGAYAGAIAADTGGALLLSVVGGKMSEGINFADRLGRCVVIVGLPFPNLHSADWKARMEYIEAAASTSAAAVSAAASTSGSASAAKDASREYYENACMRAVNQSIGRAIRHQNDYAAIVLLDRRFGSDRIRSKLPGWIRAGMPSTASTSTPERQDLGGMMTMVGGFFRSKK